VKLSSFPNIHYVSVCKKLRVARRGLYSTAALYIADCALAPNDVVPSFISRGATTPHGAKLGHGTDYFTSPPKEGMLRIFIYRKIQRLRPGLNPRTREPEASMRTTRPPKPSYLCVNVCRAALTEVLPFFGYITFVHRLLLSC
jgi:hypothetical protein